MRKTLLLAIVFLTSFTAFGQDQSNKGRDFWFAYPAHNAGTTSRLAIYLTSNLTTSGTVTFNGSTIPFTVVANQTAIVKIGSATLPSNATCYIGSNNVVEVNKGIRIQSVEPVAAYAHILNAAVSGSTLLLPINVLGREYIVASHVPQGGTAGVERCQFVVVGVVNNTTVEITPTSNDVSNTRLAGVTFQIVLNAGDVYQFQSFGELSGSVVKSIASGMGACQRIVVIGSTTRSAIGCPLGGNPSSGDNLFLQLPPKTAWGKNYLTAPFILKAQDKIRVFVSKPTTPVTVNGTNLPLSALINNAYYEFNANAAQEISSTDPIAVYQYIFTQNCDGVQSDPEMIYINPIEQTIKDIAFVSAERNLTPPQTNITSHYLNLILKSSGTSISSLTIDGVAPATTFTPIAATGYSYARINLTSTTTTASPSHRVINDSGFIAIAYGYGNVESYGYNAGTNVRDLNTRLEISNPNSIDPDPSACTNSPFQFKVYFADSTTSLTEIRYDSIQWEVLTNASNLVPNNFPVMLRGTVGSPPKLIPDSTNIRNGKYVAWYSLPGFYYATAPGVYPIRITLYKSSNEGCGNSVEYPFDLTVTDPPTASFSKNTPGCYSEPVVATETTPQLPKATYKLWWEFYDPVTNATTVVTGNGNAFRTATHTFTTPGTIAAGTAKRIRHASITTAGCLSDTLVQFIELPDIPNASILGNTTVCLNSAPAPDVTFTAVDGTPPFTFTYNINGGGALTINTIGASYTATLQHPTTVAGTFIYNLVGVRNTTPVGTPCTRVVTGQSVTVTINPLPNAAIAGATTVCLNSSPQPNVTFTGSNATAPYTFAYTINGVAQTPVVSNGAGIATIIAPTNVVGTFIYEITQVTDASSTTCSRNITGTTTTITVQELPNAAIASSTTAVCQNGTQPTVTFTGSGGTAPYTFNYTINGVAQTPVVSNAAGVATLTVPTTTVGSFIYEITQVTEGSGQTCLRVITGQTVTITVNPLPNAAIAGATSVCLNSAPAPVVTFTGSNATAPYTFDYTINGVAQAPIVSNAAGIATINAPTNVVGTFIYAITQVTDASSTACSRPINATSTTIIVQDLPNAAIGGSTNTACLNSAPLPTITFTGNTGTAPYTFTYTINGVTQPTILSNGAGVATITVPTNVATTYTYDLTAVSEASAQLCARTITGQTWVVVINPLPAATIAGAIEVCKDAPQPTVTFTGSGATAPYTFEYTINGTAQTPLVSNAAGVATVLAPTNVAGTFTYQLTRVTDASSTTCSQLQNGSTVITVNLLPTASFTYTAPSCETRTIVFTDGSSPNVGILDQWNWIFGDPGSGPLNTSGSQNTSHVFGAAGPYTVTLSVRNTKGCISNPIATTVVTINNRPVAGFIVPDVCINDVATPFTDTSKIGGGQTINRPLNQWNYGDGPPANPSNNSVGINGLHLYTATGVYQVTQIVTSTLGCKDTIVLPITINSADPVSAFTAPNSCSSDSVALTNLSTVGFGNVTRLDIYWDNVGTPAVFQTINSPAFNGVYRHKYPTLQITRTYNIRMVAYSGAVCSNQKINPVTVYATPRVQFNNIPNTCLLVPPFLLTQGSEIGGVPGTFAYSGPGITNPNGTFNPQVAGVGTHNIKYTWTASNPGACIDTLTKTITVLDTAHATFSVVLPSCEQIATSFTDLSTVPANVVLANTVWNFGDLTPVENHAPGSTFGHLFPGPGTYTVTMHNVSAVGCLSTDTSQVVTIDPNHGIALTTSNSTQTLCVNTAIADIKYQLSGGATNIVLPPSGLPPGVNATITGNVVTLAGTPTLAGVYNYSIQTTGNTCLVATASGVITVNPDHTIALTSGNNTQTLCVNTAIIDIKYQLGGGATNIVMPPAGLPPGVTASVTGNIVTLTGAPTLAGVYNYSIQTTGNTCLVANATGTITVDPDHTISLTSNNNTQTLCVNTAIVDIKYQLGGGATNIVMPPAGLPPGVTASVTGNVVTLTGAPTLAGVYNYSIQTTGNTCLVATVTGRITVDPDHTITLTSGNNMQSVCVNSAIDDITYDLGGGASGPVTFNPAALPPGITSSVVGNILTIRGAPTSTAGGPSFNYTITTNGNSCLQANASFQIQVHPYPVPDFTFDKGSYCIPNAVVGFINNTTPTPLSNYTYAWDFDDGSFSTSVAPTHQYTSQGPFNVTLKARSTVLLNGGVIGCESIIGNQLNTIHQQPKADFVSSKSSVCIGDAITFTDNTDGMGSLVNQWHWEMGDGTTKTTNPITYTYGDTITYIITMYTVNGFGCNSDTINKLPLVTTPYKPISVYPYPYRNAGPDKFVLEGGSVELEATAYAREPIYTWTPVQFLTDSKILRPRVVNPTTDMTYRLTVTGKGGCQASDDVFVKLLKFPTIPNTFTPNGDGINDQWRIDYLNSYPDNRVQIFTRAGNLIFESRGYNKPWDGTFKGKPMPFDTYYYIIEPGNGRDPITGYVTIIK